MPALLMVIIWIPCEMF